AVGIGRAVEEDYQGKRKEGRVRGTPPRSIVCRVPAATGLAAGLLVGLWPDPASAVTFTCGSTITSSVTLTSNLNCTGNPITVAGAGITVNLNGHTISNTSPCPHPEGFCTITFDAGSNGA